MKVTKTQINEPQIQSLGISISSHMIVEKRELGPQIKQIKIYAPEIAAKAKAGQFVILRTDNEGERIPLTLVSWDKTEGTITLIFQEVGVSTKKLGCPPNRRSDSKPNRTVREPQRHKILRSSCSCLRWCRNSSCLSHSKSVERSWKHCRLYSWCKKSRAANLRRGHEKSL